MDTPTRDRGPAYAELHCLTNFTFLRGASRPEELVQRAAELGYAALAITDECSVAGVVRAHAAAKTHGLKLIIGTELQLEDGPRLALLARNREGYAQLAELITTGRRRSPKGRYALRRADLEGNLSDCLALMLPETTFVDGNEDWASPTHSAGFVPRLLDGLTWLSTHFPARTWLAVERLHLPGEADRVAALVEASASCGVPLVAAGDVHMHKRGRRALQDLVTAIRLNTTVAAAGFALCPNGERHLRPLPVLAELYEPAWLAESVRIAACCTFSLDELRYEYPDDLVPAGETAAGYLRRLTEVGVRRRWPGGEPEKVRRMIEHELRLIAELKYEPYFLTVHDIVEFARTRGILCQGRGSAANSAVCYCLGITAVDPERVSMLFERFISRERNEPPDIDVDFDNARREEVMQYLYERYGRHRAALAATVITYRRKSALRDAGKALGLTLDQVDRLTKTLAWWDDGIPPARLREAGFDPDNPVIVRLLHLVDELRGFPRHLSQHVGGFVIARDRLSRLVPVENAAMAERTVIQWDKDDLDTLGLLKVDCLALGMLAAIQRCFDLLRRHGGPDLTLADVPAEDPAVYRMIQRADTIGVFQIESRAQMNMLPRLKPANYYDLVIEVAIVRPGPIQGEMVHPYLRRRRGEEPVTYPSDAVRRVLSRTLGVPLFQEQVIELAMVAAGFSGGEADELRRAIGSWRRSYRLEYFHQRLVEGMRARGYADRFAEQIFNQIKGFGEYGFPESHAASFALLVYVSAWLKCHHPAAFTCALLNSQPMGFYSPSQLVQDLRRHAVEVRPVDVLHSAWESTLEPAAAGGWALRLGLHQVKGLSRDGADRLLNARGAGRDSVPSAQPDRARQASTTEQDPQPICSDLGELIRHARLDQRDRDALAAADAFASIAGHRHQARWQALGSERLPGLLEPTAVHDERPLLPAPSEGQDIANDYASLGLTLRRHPLALLRARFTHRGWISTRDLSERPYGSRIRLAGLVTNRQHPASASGAIFITLEDEHGVANLIIWQRISERYRREVLQGRLLLVQGKVEREGMVIHIIADKLVDHTDWLGTLVTTSRDFH
ncbi:MAG: error-prone DNA polymerase [Thiotrichales bacterium]